MLDEHVQIKYDEKKTKISLFTLATTSAPNVKDTPRSFSLQSCVSLSGSDRTKQHDKRVNQIVKHIPQQIAEQSFKQKANNNY